MLKRYLSWFNCVLLIAGLGVMPNLSSAKTTNWVGGGGDDLWTNGANWDNGVPGEDDVIGINTAAVDATGTQNIAGSTMNFTDVTFSNGTINMNNPGSGGSLIATNTDFSTTAFSYFVAPVVELNNSIYKTGSGLEIFNGSTFTVNGGDYDNGNAIYVTGSGGATTMTFNGGDNTHTLGRLRLNGAVSTPPENTSPFAASTATATFNILNNASVRLSNANRGPALVVGNSGTGNAVLNFDTGVLRVDGGVLFGQNSTLQTGNSGGIGARELLYYDTFGTDWSNEMISSATFDAEGLSVTFGAESIGNNTAMEVGGTDLGEDLTGFHDNYSLDRLRFFNRGGDLTFVDNNNNDLLVGNEAMYVDILQMDAANTLDLNGLNLYYKRGVDLDDLTVVNGSITQVTGASLEGVGTTVHIDGFTTADTFEIVTSSSVFDTVIFENIAPGSQLTVLLELIGSEGDINALIAELEADGITTSTDISSEMTPGELATAGFNLALMFDTLITGDDLFFDFNFDNNNVTVGDLALVTTIPEPASLGLLVLTSVVALKHRRR